MCEAVPKVPIGRLSVPVDGFSRFFIRQDVSFRAKRNKGAPLKFFENSEYLSVLDAIE